MRATGRIRRCGVATLSAGAVALAVGACGSSDSGGSASGASTTGASAPKLTVGYSSKGSDQFQLVMQQQAVQQIKAQGLKGLQPTTSQSDPAQQITDIHNLVSGGAKGMLVAPGDSAAIGPAIQFLNTKKIPVVALDTSPTTSKVSIVVRTDNYQAGQAGCQHLGEWLKGKGTVLALQGAYTSESGKDRGDGFDDCMRNSFPDIKVIDRQMNWETDKCAQIANSQLTANKEIGGIYMASETICMAPVLSALKSSGRTAPAGQPGHVYTIGIDGSPFALKMVREGKLDGDLSQPLNLYAKYGVEYLKKAAAGQQFAAGPTDHGTKIVETGGNLTDLLPVTFVSKDNASSDELWGNAVK
jgi:ribose transport system substrate-binding protein